MSSLEDEKILHGKSDAHSGKPMAMANSVLHAVSNKMMALSRRLVSSVPSDPKSRTCDIQQLQTLQLQQHALLLQQDDVGYIAERIKNISLTLPIIWLVCRSEEWSLDTKQIYALEQQHAALTQEHSVLSLLTK